MKKISYLLSGLVLLGLLFTACNKDDSDDVLADYVGTWESTIYPDVDLSTGDVVGAQKMVFDFETSTFEGTVYAGAIGATTDAEMQEATAFKGTIDVTATQMMVEVTSVSVQGGPFTDKAIDPTIFQAKFDGSIGALLDETFTVDYSIDGTSMTFSLPINGITVPQTLSLTKVE